MNQPAEEPDENGMFIVSSVYAPNYTPPVFLHKYRSSSVCLGDPSNKGIKLPVPLAAATEQLTQLKHSLPNDAEKYALKLLFIFFKDEELAESNCTLAEGRRLLDQDVLKGIQCKRVAHVTTLVSLHSHYTLLTQWR